MHILRQAFRQQYAVGPFGHDRDEICERHSACQGVDANITAKAGRAARREESACLMSRGRTVCRYHRILEIEDQGIGTRLPAAVELALTVSGDKEQRAHYASGGRHFIRPARRQIATVSPRWLMP